MTTFPPRVPLARRWLWPLRSLARVALPDRDLAGIERVAKQLFGRVLRPEEYAGLGGAPDDALVRVGVARGRLRLAVIGSRSFRCVSAHVVFQAHGGPVLATGGHRIFDPRRRAKGLGLQMVRRQLIAARRLGVQFIVADGGRSATENGYYVGPRLGFNSSLPACVLPLLPAALRNAWCVLDLMESQAGRDWWREHGVDLDLVFDLRADSRCWAIFRQYLDEQSQRKRAPAAGKRNRHFSPPPLRRRAGALHRSKPRAAKKS